MRPSDWPDEHDALVVVGARIVENCPPSSPYCQTDRAYGVLVEVTDTDVGVNWDHCRARHKHGHVCSRYGLGKVYSPVRRSSYHGIRVEPT